MAMVTIPLAAPPSLCGCGLASVPGGLLAFPAVLPAFDEHPNKRSETVSIITSMNSKRLFFFISFLLCLKSGFGVQCVPQAVADKING
ncbi:hypothetical protein D3C86_2007530 [compost metagenome]